MLTTDILEKLQEYFELEKSEGSFSDLGLIFQTTVLGFKIAEVERRRALIELSKRYHVNVYSNSDISDMLRIQYCGSVDYWSELPQVFRMSKINLNFTIPNIKSGIPLRVWDVLGAGGFLLTNYQAEIPYYFKEGGKVAHERVGRLEEPRPVEADAPGVQAGFFEDFAPHGVFGALAAVDVSGDNDVARAAVLLNEQDAAGLFVCDDHADRRVVHGKAVFAADRAERHDALAFERLFDERRAALPAVFLYHGEKNPFVWWRFAISAIGRAISFE